MRSNQFPSITILILWPLYKIQQLRLERGSNLNVCVAMFCLIKCITCKLNTLAKPAMGLHGLMRSCHSETKNIIKETIFSERKGQSLQIFVVLESPEQAMTLKTHLGESLHGLYFHLSLHHFESKSSWSEICGDKDVFSSLNFLSK